MSKVSPKKVTRAEADVDEYPGAAVDYADNEIVDQPMVDERTCEINNNPRNNDGPEPSSQKCN